MEYHCIQLIALHKVNRKKAKTHDGRKLRPYKWKRKVERLFAVILLQFLWDAFLFNYWIRISSNKN